MGLVDFFKEIGNSIAVELDCLKAKIEAECIGDAFEEDKMIRDSIMSYAKYNKNDQETIYDLASLGYEDPFGVFNKGQEVFADKALGKNNDEIIKTRNCSMEQLKMIEEAFERCKKYRSIQGEICQLEKDKQGLHMQLEKM